VFTLSYIYELPVGRGKRFLGSAPGFVNTILGGWSINGIYTAMSGEPFSITSGARTSNFSHTSRADITGAKPEAKLQDGALGPVLFKDITGFALPAPGSDGAGRNVFVGPGYWNYDMGISKRFDLTERYTLTFRTEMFNALNHPNFDHPVAASVGSPSILSTQFGRTCCQTVAPPSTQTIIQTGEASRVIQFALKIQF
jgi:hypothetical protein